MANDSATGGFLAPSSSSLVEDAALDAILQTLVAGVTAIPGNLVRPRWQLIPPPQPEPNVDWCAIGVTDETPPDGFGAQWHVGRDASGSNPNGYSATVDWVAITVTASFYGPAARSNAALLRSGLLVGQNRETLYATGLKLVGPPDGGRFVPEIDNGRTVRRFDVSLRFNYAIQRIWPIDDLLVAQVQLTEDNSAKGDLVENIVTPSSTNPLQP